MSDYAALCNCIEQDASDEFLPPEQHADYCAYRLRLEIDRLREALQSIARNTCCEPCQEAALVAQAALDNGGE